MQVIGSENWYESHTWSNDLAGEDLDGQPAVVEVLNVDCTAGQCGQQVDLGLVGQVVTRTVETSMRLLLDLEDNIASLETWALVALALELDLLAALDALVDVHVQDLALDSRLLTLAGFAPVLIADGFALAVTVVAGCLETLDHRTHLSEHCAATLAITGTTSLDSAFLASTAIASRT